MYIFYYISFESYLERFFILLSLTGQYILLGLGKRTPLNFVLTLGLFTVRSIIHLALFCCLLQEMDDNTVLLCMTKIWFSKSSNISS
jgi:hypothetical protein